MIGAARGARTGRLGLGPYDDMGRKANELQQWQDKGDLFLVLGIGFSLLKREKSQIRDAGDPMQGKLQHLKCQTSGFEIWEEFHLQDDALT